MNINFGASMYSDPTMRPHLQKYYEAKYAPIHDRLDAMADQEPQTIQFENADGELVTGKELSAEQYRKAIPDFDKWLETQQEFSTRMADFTASSIQNARDMLSHLQENHPDTSSGVNTVFASGDMILGYLTEDGSLVTHEGGAVLQTISRRASDLGLTGEAKIAYIQKHGAEELARRHGNLQVTSYEGHNIPTKREFANTWYPHHDVDGNYQSSIKEATKQLEKAEELYQQQLKNRADMQAFLIRSMEESQNAGAPVTATASATANDNAQPTEPEQSTTVTEFLEYMEMTPEEKYFDMFLKEEGLTQEEYEALPPEDKAEITEKIQNRIEEKMKEDLGIA
ncbi:MAG: hypothetical protein VXW91_08145 [Pseudomonadota bacterium]|nr:hypothetical protein [Pseudomonadota bacterium]MEC8664846.1 hypothetical protein [Pseudomonadota bacterium]